MKNYQAMARYVELRQQRQDLRAIDVWSWVSNDDPGLAQNIDQYICRHHWVVSDEEDRCYCDQCGADGDG